MKLLPFALQGTYLVSTQQILWFRLRFKYLFSEVGSVGSKLDLSEHRGTEWASPRSISIPMLITRADRWRDRTLASYPLTDGLYCLLWWCNYTIDRCRSVITKTSINKLQIFMLLKVVDYYRKCRDFDCGSVTFQVKTWHMDSRYEQLCSMFSTRLLKKERKSRTCQLWHISNARLT
jgi:hypothetical protein